MWASVSLLPLVLTKAVVPGFFPGGEGMGEKGIVYRLDWGLYWAACIPADISLWVVASNEDGIFEMAAPSPALGPDND